ncbi:MAG: arylsulfatase [Burkholderiales bacterium]|nr:arylsulfatase [Burkholderiales bacterium]
MTEFTDFAGKIGRTREESTPWWPERREARAGSPNIVIVYMDDMGWSDPGCFGSEISTPNIDALAARGVRLTHYTTHPICSPARAALLTGCNAHGVGTGWLANNHPGYPGYSGELPMDAATLPETLRAAGYATIMVGKWHNTPAADNVPGGNKHNWPAQRGFDTFYGFMDGETHHFFPHRIMLGNELLPMDSYPRDYYSGDDWMDQGIRFVKEVRSSHPTKPFFLYVANNAMHGPLQTKPSDMAKYRGKYDRGWNAVRAERHKRQMDMGLVPPGTRLPDSDPRAPRWEATDPANRPLYARHMETFAGMLDNADQNVGKLIAFLQSIGELDNTIILFSSDNGGTDAGGEHGMVQNNRRYSGLPTQSLEHERTHLHELGGPKSVSLYPTAWGEVSNTPFPSFKTYTGGGGRRVSFIASWPAKIKDTGAIRRQFMHVIDVMPTLLELAGVPRLEQSHSLPARPFDGVSCARVLTENAPSPRSEQYYECWSNRAYYRDGWLARSLQIRGDAIDMDNWTLHHIDRDFSESIDLAMQFPDKLKELVEAFDQAAWKHFVYPLDNRTRPGKFGDAPAFLRERSNHARRFLPGQQTVHRSDVIPMVSNRTFSITVRFAQRAGDAGVLWALGDIIGGMVMYVESDRLNFHYNGFSEAQDLPPVELPPGAHAATLEYAALGERRGRGRLLLDGQEKVGWRDLSPTLMVGIFEGLDIGLDRRAPVYWELYERHGAYPYSGEITDVSIVPGERAAN